jgi:hypothetical protein
MLTQKENFKQSCRGETAYKSHACPVALQAGNRSNPKSRRKRVWRMGCAPEFSSKNGQGRKNSHTQTDVGFAEGR